MSLDLTLTPLHRINGQDQASLPGLMATVPPRRTARGRDQDRLVVYLLLAGNAVLSMGEYVQYASRAAVAFYETPGTLTSALRRAAESVNGPLYERNMSSPGHGQYITGLLALAALRESQVTLSLSGPMHAFRFSPEGVEHVFDALSGRGLGLNQATAYYFSQFTLQPNDRLLFCAKVPPAWESALKDRSATSLDATRRRLMTSTDDDMNAVLIQATEGQGALTVLRPSSEVSPAAKTPAPPPAPGVELPAAQDDESEPEAMPDAHLVQPSAYAIPPEPKEKERPDEPQDFLSALPRAKPKEMPPPEEEPEPEEEEKEKVEAPRHPSGRTRQAARTAVSGMQAWQRGAERLNQGLQNFLPRLLPGAEQGTFSPSTSFMVFIAVLIPLLVVTVASVIYFRYGRSVQYEQYLVRAQDARAQALSLTDPPAQREAWQQELFYLDKADSYSQTDQARTLRQEAQQSLDKLQGIVRLQFQPVLNGGVGTQISRLAASENDLYLLDAQHGQILHIPLTNSGFQLDSSFKCAPGSYGGYTVGPLVDILAMPTINTINATVIGIDAMGNLLYCAPGQVAQAIPLPTPDTNWGRIEAFTLDAGNLYVLDAKSRAVWVYVGKDGTFVDQPYFFFGGQIPELTDAIDLAVNGDDLYILHADGHLSTCSYSRLQTVPTRCVDPAPLVNPLPAYRDVNLFGEAHFTQMLYTTAPDSALLLLDSDGQGVFRFAPRSLELQNQLRPSAGSDNPLPQGPVSAMTLSSNHILYFALKDRVYFATDSP